MTFKNIRGFNRANPSVWFQLVGNNPTRLTKGTHDPLNIVAQFFSGRIRRHFFSNRVVTQWSAILSENKRLNSVTAFEKICCQKNEKRKTKKNKQKSFSALGDSKAAIQVNNDRPPAVYLRTSQTIPRHPSKLWVEEILHNYTSKYLATIGAIIAAQVLLVWGLPEFIILMGDRQILARAVALDDA